jgi:hypothetical protein
MVVCVICEARCSSFNTLYLHQTEKSHPDREYYCKKCNVMASSQTDFQVHLNGQPHHSRTQSNPTAFQPASSDFNCTPCNVKCLSKIRFAEHCKGKPHKAKLHSVQHDEPAKEEKEERKQSKKVKIEVKAGKRRVEIKEGKLEEKQGSNFPSEKRISKYTTWLKETAAEDKFTSAKVHLDKVRSRIDPVITLKRCFGRFHCPECSNSWASAKTVLTINWRRLVLVKKWKENCKLNNCNTATNPHFREAQFKEIIRRMFDYLAQPFADVENMDLNDPNKQNGEDPHDRSRCEFCSAGRKH